MGWLNKPFVTAGAVPDARAAIDRPDAARAGSEGRWDPPPARQPGRPWAARVRVVDDYLMLDMYTPDASSVCSVVAGK
jgi:hypothetical protein